MTRIVVRTLVWNEANAEHVKKHSVKKEEVAVSVQNFSYHKKGYSNRYIVVGRSDKRILAVVLKRQRIGEYFVVTARDADKKERRRLYEKEKSK